MAKLTKIISRFITTVVMLVTMLTAIGGTMVGTVLLTSSPAYAQQACSNNLGDRLPSFGNNCIGGLSGITGDRTGIANIIQSIANFLIFVLAAISVLFIVYGGFQYVTDDGSGSKAAQGKKIVLQALIGLVIAVVSFTLVSVVVNIVSTLNVGGAASSSGGGPSMIDLL